jgi:two-component system, NtrC family, nitrogen regulation response regulator GlnG
MPNKAITDVSTAVGPGRSSDVALSSAVPALTIVSCPQGWRVGERCLLEALSAGRDVVLTRNEPDFVAPGGALGAPLSDPFLSRKPIRFSGRRAGGGVVLHVDEGGSQVRSVGTEGQADLVGLQGRREISAEELASGFPLELAGRVVLLLHNAAAGEGVSGKADAAGPLGMVGQSAGIARVRAHVARLADLQVPVLIRGETGTGKELVARALHETGPRRQGPFVSVNLGAVPRDLAASELFGAQRGAFTGATHDREGFFAAARGGTLFLDEVGEASPEVQVLLLRVLETGEMYPVGGRKPIATDVRLIAATDAELEQRVRDGSFRAPLLHRLAGYEIRVPPLRERREDIGPLFYHFARQELEALGEAHRLSPAHPRAAPWLPAPLAVRLLRFSWPGNVRQLRNLARQIVIGSRGRDEVSVDREIAEDLDERPAAPPAPRPGADDSGVKLRRRPSEVKEAEVVAALRESAWDLKAAADRLGIPRSSMYDVIDRCQGIRTAGELSAEEIERAYRECGGDLPSMVERLQVSGRALKRRIKELGLGAKRA